MSKLHRNLNPKYTYNISDTELSVILTFNIYICRKFPTWNIFLMKLCIKNIKNKLTLIVYIHLYFSMFYSKYSYSCMFS